MEERVAEARTESANPIIWVAQIVPKDDIIALYTHASLFVCPSVYEPFGIINLEAMACGTPVVASAVGGIKEVVVHEKTGLLVPFEPVGGDRLRAERPRAVRPRPRRGRQQPARRPREAQADGPPLARAGRALLQLDEHRPLDDRLLLGPRPGLTPQPATGPIAMDFKRDAIRPAEERPRC